MLLSNHLFDILLFRNEIRNKISANYALLFFYNFKWILYQKFNKEPIDKNEILLIIIMNDKI